MENEPDPSEAGEKLVSMYCYTKSNTLPGILLFT